MSTINPYLLFIINVISLIVTIGIPSIFLIIRIEHRLTRLETQISHLKKALESCPPN